MPTDSASFIGSLCLLTTDDNANNYVWYLYMDAIERFCVFFVWVECTFVIMGKHVVF